MKPIRVFPKLLALKLLVAVDFVQSLIFIGIQKSGIGATKTPHLSYYDLNIGLPNMLFEIEMILFSLFFIWAFSLTRYRQALSVPDMTGQIARRHNPFQGLLQALNPIDVIWGLFGAAKILVRLPFGKKFLSYQAKGGGEYSAEHKVELNASPQSTQPNLMYPSPQPVAYPPQTVQQRGMV